MTLIKSISGIRGTIGGSQGDNLTPVDIVKFTAAYAEVLKKQTAHDEPLRVVIGRDARTSGLMVSNLVCGTLMSMGVDVIDAGLSTTPTVEMEVVFQQATGGIIITASHNPMQWNALKLLNSKGEFFSAQDGNRVLELADTMTFPFVEVKKLGNYTQVHDAIDRHIEAILQLDLVDVDAIKKAKLKVAIDSVNSTGGIALPKLLKALGVEEVHSLNGEPTGLFAHNPEPLPEHISELTACMKGGNIDVGFVVDPDVDRLAIVKENGEIFGEEYTPVAVAEYVLQHTKGNTVSNLSSTLALKVITEKHGGQYHAAAVGEVNVVEMMKQNHAVIGGEGNGGVIYPKLHYGRDALVGIALFLSYMTKNKLTVSRIRSQLPDYFISKNKIIIDQSMDIDNLLNVVKERYKKQPIIDIDGVRIDFDGQWVHLRKSNTEPIIRIYAESNSEATAANLAKKIMADISEYSQQRL
ncbi:MAG: phosphoglucosamine mutase [Bacteroidales bacterium]|jgi:phosphomannomutase|nr:phosphoglucosamine mutase [Bacteroidales bacterium]